MRSYLIYSLSAHSLLLAVFFFISLNAAHLKKPDTYYINFIGPSTVTNIEKTSPGENGGKKTPPAAAKTASKTPAKTALKTAPRSDDDFSSGALPKPSVLSGGAKLFEEEKKPANGREGELGGQMLTDAGNFPYPWYITQVREALWNAWAGKMPSGGSLRCTVRFSITRDGGIKSLSVEKSSGNRLFDYAAQTSVESADPLPPLPEDFYENRLTVHVEFKAME